MSCFVCVRNPLWDRDFPPSILSKIQILPSVLYKILSNLEWLLLEGEEAFRRGKYVSVLFFFFFLSKTEHGKIFSSKYSRKEVIIPLTGGVVSECLKSILTTWAKITVAKTTAIIMKAYGRLQGEAGRAEETRLENRPVLET